MIVKFISIDTRYTAYQHRMHITNFNLKYLNMSVLKSFFNLGIYAVALGLLLTSCSKEDNLFVGETDMNPVGLSMDDLHDDLTTDYEGELSTVARVSAGLPFEILVENGLDVLNSTPFALVLRSEGTSDWQPYGTIEYFASRTVILADGTMVGEGYFTIDGDEIISFTTTAENNELSNDSVSPDKITYTITGGTGKFEGASGTLVGAIKVNPTDYMLEAIDIKGQINFDN